MRTTIDAAGRVVIPKAIRKRAGLLPGRILDVRLFGGRVEIEPEPTPVHLERHGRFLVAAPQVDGSPLRAADVEQIREQLQDERARAVAAPWPRFFLTRAASS